MKRILACLFIVAVLPSITPQSSHRKSTNHSPFATVALAGHIISGTRSECSCEVGPDGVCPCCGLNINFIQAQENVDNPAIQPAPSTPNQQDSDHYDSGALLLLLALFAWNRILN